MNKFINELKILRGLERDDMFRTAADYAETGAEESLNDFLYYAYKNNVENCVLSYVQKLIIYDENAFSVQCSNGKKPNELLKKAFISDIEKINLIIDKIIKTGLVAAGSPIPPFDLKDAEQITLALTKFYADNGYGTFAENSAFIYSAGKFTPVKNPVQKQLSELKDYADEKKAILNNVSDFLSGLPYSNMLLYGDRGTGKSSTVHALLNEYKSTKLRLIEIKKEEINSIDEIRESISAQPLKFIIFIDDLSLNGTDSAVSALKAAVEGSIVGNNNTMIVATSNRRHIVSETFSDRDNSVHPSDLSEELLSLSDRFGLTVIFSSTDKTAYLSIVRQLAEDYELSTPLPDLYSLAERWAIVKGGRSPRRAEQFVKLAFSSERSGRKIEF